jgi:hypothetical protein
MRPSTRQLSLLGVDGRGDGGEPLAEVPAHQVFVRLGS